MKKAFILGIIFSFATLFHSQSVAGQVETQEVRETINKLLADVDASKNNPVKFDQALQKLQDQTRSYQDQNIYISPDTKTNVAKIIGEAFKTANPQRGTTPIETPEIKADTEALISKVEASRKDPLKLNKAIQRLSDYRPYKYASQATKSNVISRLVVIYNSIDDTLTNSANKIHIIEFIGSGNNVQEAHEFFLAVLENGKEKYRAEALRTIYFGGIPGDDIYDKVKSLVARGVIKEEDSLSALKGANPQRALPEIQEFLATTTNPKKYVGIGHLLSAYQDPSLLDVLFQRYDYFKGLPASAWPEGYGPTLCISTEMLMKYIEVNEEVKLKKALEVFEDSGVFGNRKLPVLQKKLASANLVTRKAATEFLIHQTEIGSVSRENIAPVLKDAEARETDKDLKLKLKAALKKMEPTVGGRK